jgi:predicted phage tail protein
LAGEADHLLAVRSIQNDYMSRLAITLKTFTATHTGRMLTTNENNSYLKIEIQREHAMSEKIKIEIDSHLLARLLASHQLHTQQLRCLDKSGKQQLHKLLIANLRTTNVAFV